MFLANNEKNKEKWKKKEMHLKIAIIGIIVAIMFLIIVLIFFSEKMWAIISGLAVIVGLVVDLLYLFKGRGE